MSAPTLGDLISDSFYEIGVYSPGELVDPIHVQWGGARINSMIDSWKAERLTIWRNAVLGPFPLTGGIQQYKIGTGATWDTPRPFWIDNAGLVQNVGSGSPIPEYPITVLTNDEWDKTVTKTLQSTIPTALWYDTDFDVNGFATVNIWPVPTAANTVRLYCPVPVDEFVYPGDFANPIHFPAGYRDFLMYSLAVRISPSFGKTPSPLTIDLQMKAQDKVKTTNLHLNMARVDDALVRRDTGIYNWLSDQFSYR